mgnify:CR=1 FL=1|jgi:hypothetical protein|tara:strand:- start:515 stop:631 length:117 start_codon:yes stop_codon:yes gene_type:complete
MTNLGYFVLGFLVVFVGGIWYLGKWEMFDIYMDDEDWD